MRVHFPSSRRVATRTAAFRIEDMGDADSIRRKPRMRNGGASDD
jgi:hypothetical protein